MKKAAVWLGQSSIILAALAGCTLFQHTEQSDRGTVERQPLTTLRFHLASTVPEEGDRRIRDEFGQPLYVAPRPVLTEKGIASASALHSDRRSMVLLTLKTMPAARLRRLTSDHLGWRLAVFVDDELVMSPPIKAPIVNGKVYLDGDFPRARANEIARGLDRW